MIAETLQERQLLSTIVALASTPAERLQIQWVTDASISNTDAQERLERLYKLVGAEDEEKGKLLFEYLQLSHEQVMQVLSSSPLPMEITYRPAWVITLEQILSDYSTRIPRREIGTDSVDLCLEAETPVPFEELLLPFIHYARRQLLTLFPTRPLLLSLNAYSELERWLLFQLATLAGQVFQRKFSNFRIQHNSLDASLLTGSKSRHIYNEFLSLYEGKGLLSLFSEYGVLARLLVLRVEQWIEACKEFLQRFKEDRQEIEQYFQFGNSPLGPIMQIRAGCSDPHNNGRSVLILGFSNGRKLVYKPRSLDIDRAFFHLLAWINVRGLSPQLKGLRILSRATHGWMEYTEHLPCKTQEEVQRYYQRAGQLVGLLYVLQASDMHYENMIASGEYPIPIDLETIVTPLYYSMSQDDSVPGSRIRNTIDYAVSQSTLLPMKFPIKGKSLDLSFLGCVAEFDAPSEALRWKNINTDAMIQVYEPVKLEAQKNSVVFDGSVVKPSDYIEDIVTGFRTIYDLLTTCRDDLLAPWGPLASFIGCPIRYLFRSTFIYEKLLTRLTHPHFLRTSVDRWIEMQIFKKPLLKKNTDLPLRAIVEAEVSALEQLDIPRFVALPESNDLFTERGTTIENPLSRSALEQIRACLVRLSVEDLERQTALIRETFADASVVPVEASAR